MGLLHRIVLGGKGGRGRRDRRWGMEKEGGGGRTC